MKLDWWTFAFQVINIGILLWLLGHFLFRPVANIIAERKAETARVLNDAEEAKRAATEAERAAKAERDQIAGERIELLEKARAEAEAQKKDMLAKARLQADEVVEKVRCRRREGSRGRARRACSPGVRTVRRHRRPADGEHAGRRAHRRLSAAPR